MPPMKSSRAEVRRIASSALDRTPYIPNNTQLHRVAALFLAAREHAWSHRTYQNHRYHLRRIYEVIGPVNIGEIGRAHVEAVVAARRRDGVKEISILSEYRALTALLEWCASQHIVPFPVTRTMRVREFGLPVDQRRRRSTPLLTLVRWHQDALDRRRA